VAPAGTVVGATKIVDHGADGDHFVLAVTGDGFTAAEQTVFEQTVTAFLNDLQATPPFDEVAVWQRVNVYRLDIHSTQSGSDNPSACGDDPAGYVPAPPATADTYLQTRYCTSNIRRLVTVTETQQLLDDLDLHVPAWDAVIVAVNHIEYGGSGDAPNGIAVFSLAPAATQIAIHEFAHVLGLEDEYDAGLGNTYAGADPEEPNVSTDGSGAKWISLLTAANLPTWSSSNCATSNEGVADPEPGAVGAYEGAARYHCGLYRPTHDCMMRHLGVAFCVVCESHLRDYLMEPFHIGPTTQCFVASAVYGDPSHPDVEALRAWRDRRLEAGRYGRSAMVVLVAAYERLGPVCARFTASRPRLAGALRRVVFGPLARMLRR
jgi:IgA peptidase M64